jgi:chromosomal replication initiator protein
MMRQAIAGRDEWSVAASPSSSSVNQSADPVMSENSPATQRDLWTRVRARLKAAVGEDVFTSWFARLELEELVDDLVHLSAPTRFLCSWVQSNYSDRIVEAFRHDVPEAGRLQVTLRVNGQARPRLAPAPVVAAEPVAETPAAKPNAAQAVPSEASSAAPVARLVREAQKGDALAGSAIDQRMTFDTFVSGEANEMPLVSPNRSPMRRSTTPSPSTRSISIRPWVWANRTS